MLNRSLNKTYLQQVDSIDSILTFFMPFLYRGESQVHLLLSICEVIVKNCTIENESSIFSRGGTNFTHFLLSLRKITFLFAQNNTSFRRRAGFEPTEIERILLSIHCSTSKPPRLDKRRHLFLRQALLQSQLDYIRIKGLAYIMITNLMYFFSDQAEFL